MNPIDSYLRMRKEAGFFSGWQDAATGMGRRAMLGAAVAGGGALVGAGVAAVGKIREAVTRSGDFRQMMEVDPSLKEIQAERPAFFNQAYNSLRRINPTFGGDPIIAGSYMRKMMANPDAAGLTLAQSVKPPALPESSLGVGASVGEKGLGLDFKF